MKLIRELVEDVQFVAEATDDGKKNYFIEGIWMQSGIVNRNGRRYPEGVMENAVNKYIVEFVNQKRSYGELGHPSGPTINPERISHRIIKLEQDGKNWVGKAQISSTPYGKIAQGLMEDGGRLGVSSRGLGSLKDVSEGVMEVQKDFYIATAGDIVVDPSAPQAFVEGVMESVDWIVDATSGNWRAQNTLDQIEQTAKGMSKRQLEEHTLALWQKFLKSFH